MLSPESRTRTEAFLAVEQRTLRMIGEGAPLKEILNELCVAFDTQVPEGLSTITLKDPDGEWLIPVVGPRIPSVYAKRFTRMPIQPGGSCNASAFFKKRVVISDIATDPTWPEEHRQPAIDAGLKATLSQPLLSSTNDILGTLAWWYTETRTPSAQEIELVEAAGQIVQSTIERERSASSLRMALKESEKSASELKTLIDTIPTLVWCGKPDGSSEFVNQRWIAYTGLTAQDLLGLGWARVIHPDDYFELTTKVTDSFATAETFEVEARLKRLDGEYRWFLLRFEPVPGQLNKVDRWYGSATDIHVMRQGLETVRQEQAELWRMVDSIPAAIHFMDAQGKVLYVNQASLEYTGLQAKDADDPNFRDKIFHPDDEKALRDSRNRSFAAGVPFQLETRARRRDGVYHWFLIHYKPFYDGSGKLIRWYATGTDIEDRRRVENMVRNENVALREDVVRSSMFEEIVGSSEALRKVLVQVSKVAPTSASVLILGETGTGKELIARAIHNASPRAKRAFIKVNCASIPSALIASELFGHEKGSFTGALQRHLGRFELADGGTIFLDEVGELPTETQAVLLRVLQERQFERVGGSQTISVDVRVIAATNRDIEAAVAEGIFRQDLLYRLNVFPIQVPSLRERAGDIPLLVAYLVDRYAHKAGKKLRNISKQTMSLFESYSWPGNIRELQNVIERAVILCDSETFSADESWFKQTFSKPGMTRVPLLEELVERERGMIEAALRECHGIVGGKNGAAYRLGIPRQTLISKIKKLGINQHLFKAV